VLDNGLRENKTLFYSTTIRLDTPGYYDAVLSCSTRRVRFTVLVLLVDANPALQKPLAAGLNSAGQLSTDSPVVGPVVHLAFQMIDGRYRRGKTRSECLDVLVYSGAGESGNSAWRRCQSATEFMK
jgi:hypothetical protein